MTNQFRVVLKQQKGFTIVELLIVIVIIGILVALVIAGYNGIQGRAKDEVVRSDLRNAATKVEVYFTTNTQYSNTTTLANVGIAVSKSSGAYRAGNNLLYCSTASLTDYALIARSDSGTTYVITSQTKSVNVFSGATFPNDGASANCTAAIGTSPFRAFGWNGTTWQAWVGGN